MNKHLMIGLLAWGALSVLPAAAYAQNAVDPLSPEDYIEIRQLAARYGHAVDTGAYDGEAYASLFAPDATFGDPADPTTGADALAELARQTTRGPQTAWHYIVNHIIDPAPGGATGKQFLVHFRYGDPDEPNGVFGGGHYEDEYVKTADGWRFKHRQFIPSLGTPETLTTAQTTGEEQ